MGLAGSTFSFRNNVDTFSEQQYISGSYGYASFWL